MHKLVSASRYLILIAVAGSFLAGLTLLASGGASVFSHLSTAIQSGSFIGKAAKYLMLGMIEAVDLFLLGTVFLIIALGLYELFIDATIPVPSWLEINSLDDLKSKLLGVVVVVMGVVFLGHVVNWHGEPEIAWFGIAIASVVASLTWFLGSGKKK